MSHFYKMLQSVGRKKLSKLKVTDKHLHRYQEQYETALSAVREIVTSQDQ